MSGSMISSALSLPSRIASDAARPGMLQIMCQAILERLAFLRRVIQHFAHPEPGFGQHIVIVADVDGAVQITAGAFPVACFGFDDSALRSSLP